MSTCLTHFWIDMLKVKPKSLETIVWYFIFCLILFLPKRGILDFSLFFTLTITCLKIIQLRYKLHLDKISKQFLLILFLIVSCSAVSAITFFFQTNEFDNYWILKHFKYFLEFLCFSTLIYNHNNRRILISALRYTLYTHVGIIYIQLLFFDLRPSFYAFSGFDPDFPVYYRVPGLSLGYDAASLLCVAALSFALFTTRKQWVSLLILPSLFVTARTGVILGFFVFSIFIIQYQLQGKLQISSKKRFITLITIFFIISLGAYFGGKTASSSQDIFILALKRSFSTSSAIRSQTKVFDTFLLAKDNPVLGTGFRPFSKFNNMSDTAYSQYAQGNGILGVSLILLLYLASFFLFPIRHSNLHFLLGTLVLCNLIGSLKGPYFLCRQYTEVQFIITIILINSHFKTNKNRLDCIK